MCAELEWLGGIYVPPDEDPAQAWAALDRLGASSRGVVRLQPGCSSRGERQEVVWAMDRPLRYARGELGQRFRYAQDRVMIRFWGIHWMPLIDAHGQWCSDHHLDRTTVRFLLPRPRQWRRPTRELVTTQRQVCQTASGGSFFAQLTLSLAPLPGDEVRFALIEGQSASLWPDEHRLVHRVVERALAEQAVYLGLSGALLCVSDVRIHPVDFKLPAFESCAIIALKWLFAQLDGCEEADEGDREL